MSELTSLVESSMGNKGAGGWRRGRTEGRLQGTVIPVMDLHSQQQHLLIYNIHTHIQKRLGQFIHLAWRCSGVAWASTPLLSTVFDGA